MTEKLFDHLSEAVLTTTNPNDNPQPFEGDTS